jgi:hypothetical protein
MRWIETLGGPFILMEERLAIGWGGHRRSTFPGYESDYEMASRVKGWAALLPVGDGCGIVMWGDALRATLFQSSWGSPVIVRWEYAETEEDVIKHLRNLQVDVFEQGDIEHLVTKTERMMLFDSVHTMDTIEDSIGFTLNPGRHTLRTVEWHPDASTSLVIHSMDPDP